MLISAYRTGGFAGLRELVAHADTDRLDDEQRAAAMSLIDGMRFFAMPPSGNREVGAGLPAFELTVTDGAKSRTVTFSATKTPENERLHSLLDLLARSAPQ